MQVAEVLDRLGGVADAGTLVRATSRKRLRRALRSGEVERDSHGRYSLPGGDEAVRAAARLSGVLCLDSAARHHGWKLKQNPRSPAVAVPRNRNVTPRRREGVRIVYSACNEVDRLNGVTAPVRTVMDCAARLPFDEALAIADSALRNKDVRPAELLEAAEQMPARYRAKCRRIAHHADGRAANPFESVLRAIVILLGLDGRPQQWVAGCRVDLLVPELGLVLEAESFEFHGRRELLKRDCERYNSIACGGLTVIRFAWEHVMFEREYVEQVLRKVLSKSL